MKNPVRSIDEPEPKKTLRADRPPIDGFVTIVDGHFKSEFDTVDAAEASGRKLKSTYPMLQIEIYDANRKKSRRQPRRLLALLYGPAARCKPKMTIRR